MKRRMEPEDDWDENSEEPKGMTRMEACADLVTALIVAAMLGWVIYTFGF